MVYDRQEETWVELPLLSVSFTPLLELSPSMISLSVLSSVVLRSVGTKITD